jgi:hypothetical protein
MTHPATIAAGVAPACLAACVLAALAACGSDDGERHREYSADLAPHSASGPVEIKLLALSERSDALRLRVRVDNRTGTPVELKATDWQARWAQVAIDGHAQPAEVSVPVDDPDDRWPTERPLRRDAEVAPYRSAVFLLDCRLATPPAVDAAIALTVNASLGGAPLALTVQIPPPR